MAAAVVAAADNPYSGSGGVGGASARDVTVGGAMDGSGVLTAFGVLQRSAH